MKRASLSDGDLRSLELEVQRILLAAGLPSNGISNFAKSDFSPRCKVHTEQFKIELRIADTASVGIVHCGCDNWLQPVDPPPRNMTEMAQDFAEEILWYWNRRGNAMTMMETVRAAAEAEFGKARSQGLEWSVTDVSLYLFETFTGRRQEAEVKFDLMHESLVPYQWARCFSTPAEIKKFVRSVRPYQVALAKRRDSLAKTGARGAIDALATAVFHEAGRDILAAAKATTRDPRSRSFDINGTEVILRWQMATLQGRFALAPGVYWHFPNIRFDGSDNPARCAVAGRRLTEYFESPLLPPDALVRRVSLDPKATTLLIDPVVRLFGLTDGEPVWI